MCGAPRLGLKPPAIWRAVADGWELARRESEPGMAALLRGLFQSQSRPPQPSQALLPLRFPGRSNPSVPRSARLAQQEGVASLFIRDLLGMMVTLMPPLRLVTKNI